jgi:cytidine deaminase
MDIENLFNIARKTAKNSYSPYSNFKVGAALSTEDGSIFTGTNIENASFGLTICAERVAVFNAISKGHSSFTDIAITSSSDMSTYPCGACRQVLYEFSPEIGIHIEGNENNVFGLTDLLPYAFNAKQIKSVE